MEIGDLRRRCAMRMREIIKGRSLLVTAVAVCLLLLGSCAKKGSDQAGLSRNKVGEAGEGKQKTGAEAKTVYHCPMHPSYTSDKPGNCPICGMKLVKSESANVTQEPMQMTPGEVMISPEKQQLIGLTTGEVGYKDLTQTIRTVGKVDYNEKGLAQVSARIGGRIDRLFVNFTGAEVRKGEPLLSLYSPELVSAQEEYLLARETPDPWVGPCLRVRKKGGQPWRMPRAGNCFSGVSRSRSLRSWIRRTRFKRISPSTPPRAG